MARRKRDNRGRKTCGLISGGQHGRSRQQFAIYQPPKIPCRNRCRCRRQRVPDAVIAQAAPIKIGVLTVKTGPLAAGGIHCEEGIQTFLRDKNFTLAGRKIDMVVADSGGNPAAPRPRRWNLSSATKSA